MVKLIVKIEMRYAKEVLDVSLPERNLLSVVDLNDVSGVQDENAEIERAIQNPIGHDGIRALAKKLKKTLILVDDFTRTTPAYKILPPLLEELNKAGISDRDIKIMFAGGTHRRMNHEEVLQKIGKQVLDRFEILRHDIETVKNKAALVDLGKTPLGTPVAVNKRVMEAEI